MERASEPSPAIPRVPSQLSTPSLLRDDDQERPANGRRKMAQINGSRRRRLVEWVRAHLAHVPLHVTGLRGFWILWLFYHERVVFDRAASRCRWPMRAKTGASASSSSSPTSQGSPETQEADAFKVLLVTDPQIIDRFTYPLLPLPSITFPLVRHFSDHYLRNVWRSLVLDPHRWERRQREASSPQERAAQASGTSLPARRSRQRPALPDAIVWLGDLTDGGRREMPQSEWSALHDRFDSIFSIRSLRKTPSSASGARLTLTRRGSPRDPLPIFYMAGNHDIGLPIAAGQRDMAPTSEGSKAQFVQRYGLPVDDEGMAMDGSVQAATRSLNARIGITLPSSDQATVEPTYELVLVNAEDLVGMQRTGGGPFDTHLLPSHQGQLDGALREEAHRSFRETFDFVERIGNQTTSAHPVRVLLSHVPLHRPEGTQCNYPYRSPVHHMYRESSRPLHQDTDRFSTYQNLLGKEVSNWLMDQIDPAVVFSGDDHDHCERAHQRVARRSRSTMVEGFKDSEVPELTVKSVSMTEGVRIPGLARLSLFPPSSEGAGVTMSYTPCALPDQIRIWTHAYIPAFAVCLLLLLVCTARSSTASSQASKHEILPTASTSSTNQDASKSKWAAQRKTKRRDSIELSDLNEAQGLSNSAKESSAARSDGFWYDLREVCLVAVPFWLMCQAGIL